MKRISVLLLALGLFAACGGDPPPTQGYIRQRIYTPSHWEGGYESKTNYEYFCGLQANGKYGCGLGPHTEQVWEDHHEFVQDSWKFYLEDCHADKNGQQVCNKGWLAVDETDYHRFDLGQHFPDAR